MVILSELVGNIGASTEVIITRVKNDPRMELLCFKCSALKSKYWVIENDRFSSEDSSDF